jgi:hypothetical protein
LCGWWPLTTSGGGHIVSVVSECSVYETTGLIWEISDISPHTVIRHVSNIFGKINVSNRAEATTYAHRNNLLPEA